MAIFRLRGAGTKGIVTDMPSFDTPPDTWTEGLNVRFEAGRVQKVGGWYPTTYAKMPNEIPFAMTRIPLVPGVVYGTEKHLWRANGDEHQNMNKLDSSNNPIEYHADMQHPWTYTNLSNVLVFNNTVDTPQVLLPTNTTTGNWKFQDLTGWGVSKTLGNDKGKVFNWRATRIVAYKTFLVALGIQEDNAVLKQRVRWSDSAEPNTMPTNWHDDDENSAGGFNDLTNSMGSIQDGLPLRDSMIIYTDSDTYAMDHVGGSGVFNFRKIFSDSGILAPGCVTEFEGQHFVISTDDILVHDGSTRTPVAASRVKEYLLREISSVRYESTKIFTNHAHKEIWICYVGADTTGVASIYNNYACNRAAIWNWQYNTWSFCELPRIFDISLAIPPDVDTRQWNKYPAPNVIDPNTGLSSTPTVPSGVNPLEYNWDAVKRANEQWRGASEAFDKRRLIACSLDKCLYVLDDGYFHSNIKFTKYDTTNGNTVDIQSLPVSCEITKTGIDFDEQEPDISYNKMWRAIYPQMGGKGSVEISVGGSMSPTGTVWWDSTSTFKIGEDHKIDVWSNYKYGAIKFTDYSEGQWDFTGYDIEYVREGNR